MGVQCVRIVYIDIRYVSLYFAQKIFYLQERLIKGTQGVLGGKLFPPVLFHFLCFRRRRKLIFSESESNNVAV